MLGVLQRRDCCIGRRSRDVERSANAVHGVDDVGRTIHPADTQRREAVNLREGARHHRVFGGSDHFDAGFVIVLRDVFGIGRVDHQQHMRRQAGAQPLDLVERHIGSGRVVRIGEPHHLGARRHCTEDRIDVSGVILLCSHHVDRAVAHRRDRVHQKAVRGVNRLVARAEIGVRQIVQDFIGARAANDAVGIEAIGAPDGFAQRARGAFRIVFEMIGRGLVRGNRLRRRTERRLVGGELEHAAAQARAALARRVGCNIENALLRHWTRHQRNSERTITWLRQPAGPYSALHGFRRGPRNAQKLPRRPVRR